jgi:hypothetical protein
MTMAAVVVFCTVYALVLPAITKASDPICGLEEHTHTDGCYRTHEKVPQCPAAHSQLAVLHQHGELCYDEYGVLVCPLAQVQEHLHSEACQVMENTLVCLIDEIPAHSHGQDCYTHTKDLVCTLSECQPHAHGEECYAQEGTLICGLEETPAPIQSKLETQSLKSSARCPALTKSSITTCSASPQVFFSAISESYFEKTSLWMPL